MASPSPPRKSPNSHTRPSWPGGILPTASGLPGLCGVERAGEPSRGKVEHFQDRGGSMGQGMQGMLPCISREALASYWPVEKIPRLARRKMQGGWGGAGRCGCRRGRVPLSLFTAGSPQFHNLVIPNNSTFGGDGHKSGCGSGGARQSVCLQKGWELHPHFSIPRSMSRSLSSSQPHPQAPFPGFWQAWSWALIAG